MKKLLLIATMVMLGFTGMAQEVNSTNQEPTKISNKNKQAIENARQKQKKVSEARQDPDSTNKEQSLRTDSLRKGGAMKVDTLHR